MKTNLLCQPISFLFIFSKVLTVYGCNFERKTLCQWSQDVTDNFNWTLNSGGTSSDGSGPNSDHTYGNSNSFRYKFCFVNLVFIFLI